MRSINAVLLGDCGEHLATLQNRDRSHLRLVVFFHNDYFGGAVHLEFHGCAVQHIAFRAADGLLDQLIFAVAKGVRAGAGVPCYPYRRHQYPPA